TLAYYFNSEGDKAKSNQVLNKMEENFPKHIVPYDYRIQYDVAMLYYRNDNRSKFDELSPEVEQKALEVLRKNPSDIQSFWNPYKLLTDIYEARGDYSRAIDILSQLEKITPNNPEVKMKIEMLRKKQQGGQ
ncbi:MAG: hypothetical protein N2510_02350, partial [Ignavibacteria bacterium]|nr:hypothetical protein [Ignavibacteria bacterium]